MKWFDQRMGTMKAKKHSFEFLIKINDYFIEDREFFVYVKDLKTGFFFNTSWRNMSFADRDQAKKWCDDFSEKYKYDRITMELMENWFGEEL